MITRKKWTKWTKWNRRKSIEQDEICGIRNYLRFFRRFFDDFFVVDYFDDFFDDFSTIFLTIFLSLIENSRDEIMKTKWKETKKMTQEKFVEFFLFAILFDFFVIFVNRRFWGRNNEKKRKERKNDTEFLFIRNPLRFLRRLRRR